MGSWAGRMVMTMAFGAGKVVVRWPQWMKLPNRWYGQLRITGLCTADCRCWIWSGEGQPLGLLLR